MHPKIRRNFPFFRELDHVHGRRISAFLARPTFQRRFELPDRRGATNVSERNACARFTSIALNLYLKRRQMIDLCLIKSV